MSVLVVIGIVLIAGLIALVVWLGSEELDSQPTKVSKPQPPPSPVKRVVQPPTPTPTRLDLPSAELELVLQRQLGQEYAAEQGRVRSHVLQQEQKVASRLTKAVATYDFESLKALHNESRQTADQAYLLMDQANEAYRSLSTAIRQVHQSRDTRVVSQATYRSSLSALHHDRDIVREFRSRYLADVHRLNEQTGNLRDAIHVRCGEPGRKWYEALMRRTAARRQET